MTEEQRLLGRLEEFMEQTKQDLAEIKLCMDDLKAFKIKVLAVSSAAAAVISAIARFL